MLREFSLPHLDNKFELTIFIYKASGKSFRFVNQHNSDDDIRTKTNIKLNHIVVATQKINKTFEGLHSNIILKQQRKLYLYIFFFLFLFVKLDTHTYTHATQRFRSEACT